MSDVAVSEKGVRAWIEELDLKPHPEGGWYREIYRSSQQVQANRGSRSAITAIYYLLERTQLSRWHVVESDEIWHFHSGNPLELLAYHPDERVLERHLLGAAAEHEPVVAIAHGVWQAARTLGDFSLVGCDVGPGFDFQDFRFVVDIPQYLTHFEGALAPFASLL